MECVHSLDEIRENMAVLDHYLEKKCESEYSLPRYKKSPWCMHQGDFYVSGLGQSGGDDGHGIDLHGVAATGQVVDGGVQAQQDRCTIL